MERLPLPVTKSNLLRLKEELTFAQDGLELLDDKKEALITHIRSLSVRADEVRIQLASVLKEAYGRLEEAISIHGRLACERASQAVRLDETLQVREKSFMGVLLPAVSLDAPPLQPNYGAGETGMSMDSVGLSIREALATVTELAELDVSMFRLVEETRKTIKRMNALENIYIPLYEVTLKHIQERLEEKEREALFQLKRSKRRFTSESPSRNGQ